MSERYTKVARRTMRAYLREQGMTRAQLFRPCPWWVPRRMWGMLRRWVLRDP